LPDVDDLFGYANGAASSLSSSSLAAARPGSRQGPSSADLKLDPEMLRPISQEKAYPVDGPFDMAERVARAREERVRFG
jgi:hypothetical protein